MINVLLLKSEIVKNGYTQTQFCEKIGMAPSTFIRKVKNGTITTNEAEKMVKVLKIERPETVFFAQ